MINQNSIVAMCNRALDYISRRAEIIESFSYKYFVRAISDMLLSMGNYADIKIASENTSDFQELQQRFDSFMSKLGVTCNSNKISDKIKAIKEFCEF